MASMKAKLHGVFLLFCALLLAALACGKTAVTSSSPSTETTTETTAASPPLGDSEHTLTVGGLERSYVLHLPPGYDASRPAPLVLDFHGITLDACEMMRISGLNAQSDAAGFIVVYPNAYGEQRSWNGGHCCGEAARENTDDVDFAENVKGSLEPGKFADVIVWHDNPYTAAAEDIVNLTIDLTIVDGKVVYQA